MMMTSESIHEDDFKTLKRQRMPRISLSSMWGRIADRGRALFNLPESRSPADLAIKLCDKLVSTQGEASGTALAREVVDLYGKLDDASIKALAKWLSGEK